MLFFPGHARSNAAAARARRLGVAEAQDHRRGSRGLAGGEVGGFARRAPGDEGSRAFRSRRAAATFIETLSPEPLVSSSDVFASRGVSTRPAVSAGGDASRRTTKPSFARVSAKSRRVRPSASRNHSTVSSPYSVAPSDGHASVSARRRQRHLDAGFAPPDVDSEARITRQRHVEQRARLHDERPHAHGVEVERLRRGPRRHQRRALWWTPCVFSERSEQQRSSLVRGVLRFVGIRVSRNQIAVTLTRHSDARGVRVGFPRGIRP